MHGRSRRGVYFSYCGWVGGYLCCFLESGWNVWFPAPGHQPCCFLWWVPAVRTGAGPSPGSGWSWEL